MRRGRPEEVFQAARLREAGCVRAGLCVRESAALEFGISSDPAGLPVSDPPSRMRQILFAASASKSPFLSPAQPVWTAVTVVTLWTRQNVRNESSRGADGSTHSSSSTLGNEQLSMRRASTRSLASSRNAMICSRETRRETFQEIFD